MVQLNGKNRRTLHAVFTDPISASMVWSDVESLFIALKCQVIEGSGSRVRFERNGVVAIFHRPHPQKEAKRYQVRDAREFLVKLGEAP